MGEFDFFFSVVIKENTFILQRFLAQKYENVNLHITSSKVNCGQASSEKPLIDSGIIYFEDSNTWTKAINRGTNLEENNVVELNNGKVYIDLTNKGTLYLKIDKEGINLISLVFYDPDMQAQLDKCKANKMSKNTNGFNFEALELLDLEDDLEEILNKPMDKKLIFKLINRLFLLDIAVKIFGKNK